MSTHRTIHQRYGLKRVINAWGKATRYGTSRSPAPIAEATAEALQHFFDMEALEELAGQAIADFAGAEAGALTHCTAAAITLATAATMTGVDPGRISQLPCVDGMPSRVLLQAAHNINFGATTAQMLRLAGAEVVLVGAANRCLPYQIEHELKRGQVACVFYVESRLASQHSSLPLDEVATLARRYKVPVIVDAAAQDQRLPVLLQQGADLVLAGVQKYLRGPTAGLIAGRADLVAATKAQHNGIGRTMKPSKEAILGTLAALHYRANTSPVSNKQNADLAVRRAADKFNAIPGLTATPEPDPNGNPFSLLRLDFDTALWPQPITSLVQEFAKRDPIIVLAPHFAPAGYLVLELHELRDDEIDELVAAFRQASKPAS